MINFKENGPGVFADPTIDFAFKRIFGTEKYKAATIGLLNDFIKDRHISGVTFNNNELTERISHGRRSVIDILCEDTDGSKFIVELQKAEQTHFRERMIFYASKLISEQEGIRGRWDYSIAPTYVVSFLNFSFDEIPGKVIYHYETLENERNTKLPGSTEYYFMDLKKYAMSAKAPESNEENWLYLLTHSKDMDEVPADLAENDAFRSFFEASKRANFSPEENQKYLEDMVNENDRYNELREAKEKSLAQGRAEGRYEIAKTMLASGVAVELISKYTGLSAEQVKAI